MRQLFLKYTSLFLVLLLISASYAQEVKDSLGKDRDWRIEIEPSAFVLKGYGLQVSHNIGKDNRFNIGLYSDIIDIPTWAKKGLFDNVPDESDVRLGLKIALVARYKLKIGKKESNPYIGLLTGWQYFDISPPSATKVSISTAFISPNLGYELYFYKEMLYINPQVTGIFYMASESSIPNRPEAMKPFFLLPAISLGVRL